MSPRWLTDLDTAIDDGYADDMPDLDAHSAFQQILEAEGWGC